MTQPESQIPYQVVVFTSRHSISGEVTLKDKRLSDYLNEVNESMLHLKNVTISRLDKSTKELDKVVNVTIPKANIVLVFEPPQEVMPPSSRFYGYVETTKNAVCLILNGMEVHGILHTRGHMDPRRFLSANKLPFLPITEATVLLGVEYNLVVRQETVLINSQHIQCLGQRQFNPATLRGKTGPLQRD